MAKKSPLLRVPSEDYGPAYREHLLEQYKLYVEMADRISHRRSVANSFFLTLHTGLFGLAASLTGISFGQAENEAAGLTAAIFGLPFAYMWWRILESYRQLNSGKYQVVHDLEALLPAAPYDDEWDKLGRGEDPKKYTQLTKVEGWVPLVFALGYLATATLAVGLII